jgi:hypothetical protein
MEEQLYDNKHKRQSCKRTNEMLVFLKSKGIQKGKNVIKQGLSQEWKLFCPPLQLKWVSVSRGKIKNLLVHIFSGGMVLQNQNRALALEKNVRSAKRVHNN